MERHVERVPPEEEDELTPIGSTTTASEDGRRGDITEEAKFKRIYIHGFDSCKHDFFFFHNLSPTLLEELKICIVSFDRPGYGESDPDPNKVAFDIEELADDGLGLGPKFYVLGFSMGIGRSNHLVLSSLHPSQAKPGLLLVCVKIHDTSVESLIIVLQVSWSGSDSACMDASSGSLCTLAYFLLEHPEMVLTRLLHFSDPSILSRQDKDIFSKLGFNDLNQQGEYESLHRYLITGYGHWEFDPLDLQDPFNNSNGSVHIWHGDEYMFVPASLQRFIISKLPWFRYHEVTGSGHFFPCLNG
ncbi:hypothetical protein Bca4012_035908 [Brassica carinata]